MTAIVFIGLQTQISNIGVFLLQLLFVSLIKILFIWLFYEQDCLPLIDDLSNPAMRTRHWKQLVRVTGGVIQIDNETLKKMTLGELLSLGLTSK